jgi:hypothetical protein
MGRKIKGYKSHDEREYIPEAFGNRDDSNPIRVWIKTPTEKDKREVEGDGSVIRFAVDDEGMPLRDKEGNPVMEIDNEETMRRHHKAIERFVAKVDNYAGPDGDIVTGRQFSEYGETAIVTEVYREIMASISLSDEEAKKSEGLPSSSVATQACSGIASSACGLMTSEPEIVPEERESSTT